MLVSRLAPTRKLVLPVRQLAGLLGRYLKFDDDFSTCGDDQLKGSQTRCVLYVFWWQDWCSQVGGYFLCSGRVPREFLGRAGL